MTDRYQDINARTVDRWAQEGWAWAVPISRDAYARTKAGAWQMVLTPNKPVPKAWFPPLAGCRPSSRRWVPYARCWIIRRSSWRASACWQPVRGMTLPSCATI